MCPIKRDEFETAKIKQETTDELTVKIYAFLKEHPDDAYSTRELMDEFGIKDTDQILSRCNKLKKERKIDGFKPKHQRLYYWILLKPGKPNPRKLADEEANQVNQEEGEEEDESTEES